MTTAVETRTRPVVGLSLIVIGVVHVLITPIVAGDSLDSILDGGLVGAVEAESDLLELRGYAFWYVTAGVAMIMLGVLVRACELADGGPPPVLAWLLVVLGVWGVLMIPVSPFWLFLALAVVAFRRAPRRGE